MANNLKQTVVVDENSIKLIESTLIRIGRNLAGPMIEASFFKAGRPIQEGAKVKVPVDSGNLRDSIQRSRLSEDKHGSYGVRIKSRRSKKFPHGYIAHLIEFGSKVVVRRRGRFGKGLYTVGHQPARPFLRPAFVENTNQALSILKTELAKRLLKKTGF